MVLVKDDIQDRDLWNDYPLLTAFRGTAASACLSTQPPSVALIAAVVLALLGGGRGKQQ
jgi:hypothetical protein